MDYLNDFVRLTDIACSDSEREQRTGMPEIILSDSKSIAHTLTIAQTLLEREGRAILSRVSPDLLACLHKQFPGQVETGISASTVVVRSPNHTIVRTGGQVGILAAGTSDIPIAEEASIMCREAGCIVQTAYDVGVAGLHRLRTPLTMMLHENPVDVFLVIAGMDGALASVVAGLVDVPIIGVPTSAGYGMGGQGRAALLCMLQSCAPGMTVVNIDNGIGAGAAAARIANRIAAARTQQHP